MPGLLSFTFLARSASATGTALVSAGGAAYPELGTADGRNWGQKLYFLQISGNTVSAALYVHPYDVPAAGPWVSATAFAGTAGTTASGFLTGLYPFMVVALTYVSGADNTGALNFGIAGGRAGI